MQAAVSTPDRNAGKPPADVQPTLSPGESRASEWIAERDDLSPTIHELERRCAHLMKERDAEREQLSSQIRDAHMRRELLLRIQDELRTKLASMAHALSDVTYGAECLVTECEGGLRLPGLAVAAASNHPVPSPGLSTVRPDSKSDADIPWTV